MGWDSTRRQFFICSTSSRWPRKAADMASCSHWRLCRVRQGGREKQTLSIIDSGVTAAAKLLQSCPTLCDPIDGSPPGFPIPGIVQAGVTVINNNSWGVPGGLLVKSWHFHCKGNRFDP